MNYKQSTNQVPFNWTEALKNLNSTFSDLHSDLMSDPHPRPTSAPPELIRITKEGLFAFPPGGYKSKLSTDTEQFPSIKPDQNSQNLLLDIMSPQNGLTDGYLRQFPHLNKINVNHIFDKQNMAFQGSNDQHFRNIENNNHIVESPLSPTDNETHLADLQTPSVDTLLSSIGLTTSPNSVSPTSNQSTNLLMGGTSNFSSPQNNTQYKHTSPQNNTIYNTMQQDSLKTLQETFYGGNINLYDNNLGPYDNSIPQFNASITPYDTNYHTKPTHQEYKALSPSNDSYSDILKQHNQLYNHPYHPINNTQQDFKNDSMSGDRQGSHGSSNYKTPTLDSNHSDYLSAFVSNTSRNKNNTNRSSTSKSNNRKTSPKPRSNPSLAALEELAKTDCYKGRVVAIAKDQAGGRMLQSKLDINKPEHINAIFEEALDHIVKLMVDPFANYLCQKLMEVSTEAQMTKIIDKVAPDLVDISLNMHGTRAVQKLIEMLYTADQVNKVTSALTKSVVTLVTDLNGNHVIQKCLSKLQPQDCNFIYFSMIGYCAEVATHRHGCCVLQRCIDAASPTQKSMLIQEICQNATVLVQDPYGNYVVQYILSLKDGGINDQVIQQLSGSFEHLAKQKFSSNVVEKCLTVGNPEQQKAIIHELLKGGKDSLKKLLLDAFANYVVQRALHVAQDPELNLLLEGIRPCIKDLQSSSSGKKVVAKLQKKFSSLNLFNGSTTSVPGTTQQPQPPYDFNRVAPQNNNISTIPYHSRGNIYIPPEQYNNYGDITQAMIDRRNPSGRGFYPHQTHPMPNQMSPANFTSRLSMENLQHALVLSEHGPYPSQTPAFPSTPESFMTPHLQPHAYPNHPTLFFPNDISHFQVQNVYSPAQNYLSNSEMHHLSSPQVVSLPGSYTNSNFNRMSSLNLNTAYPTKASSAGWG